MEYLGHLNRIDQDEAIGETWIEALIRQFKFPNSSILFATLLYLNKRIESLDPKSQTVENAIGNNAETNTETGNSRGSTCNCDLPIINDVWWWTKYFAIDQTKVVIISARRNTCEGNAGNSHLTFSLEGQELEWMKQDKVVCAGVILLKNYVDPECEEKKEHTAWKTITDNLLEFMTNNFHHAVFILDGLCNSNSLRPDSYSYPFLDNDPRVLRTGEGRGNLEGIIDGLGLDQSTLDTCNDILVKRFASQPIFWKNKI